MFHDLSTYLSLMPCPFIITPSKGVATAEISKPFPVPTFSHSTQLRLYTLMWYELYNLVMHISFKTEQKPY